MNRRKEGGLVKIPCKGQVPTKNNTTINFYNPAIKVINDRFKVCRNFSNASIELGNLGDAQHKVFVSSDRSSYSDDGLLYIRQWQRQQLFQIFTQSIDAIDVTSVTLSRLNIINAIDVTRC